MGFDPGLPRKYGMCTMLVSLGSRLAIGLGNGDGGKGGVGGSIIAKGINLFEPLLLVKFLRFKT